MLPDDAAAAGDEDLGGVRGAAALGINGGDGPDGFGVGPDGFGVGDAGRGAGKDLDFGFALAKGTRAAGNSAAIVPFKDLAGRSTGGAMPDSRLTPTSFVNPTDGADISISAPPSSPSTPPLPLAAASPGSSSSSAHPGRGGRVGSWVGGAGSSRGSRAGASPSGAGGTPAAYMLFCNANIFKHETTHDHAKQYQTPKDD